MFGQINNSYYFCGAKKESSNELWKKEIAEDV
jgi:hypothetical protein